jgi:SMC interacting uncharacterized protein involved in chromosome segregation
MAGNFTDLDLSKHDSTPDSDAVETATGRLARQKEDIADKVANAAEEIERLRLRQDELEYAKQALQELNNKQNSYDQGKKEMLTSLSRSVLQMEKDEVRAARMVELLASTRDKFKDLLAEIHDIHEERWAEDEFEEELDRALALIENARMVYNKSVAKIDAESWQRGERGAGTLVPLEGTAGLSLADKGFGFWLKVGVAIALPIVLGLSALAAAYLWVSGGW